MRPSVGPRERSWPRPRPKRPTCGGAGNKAEAVRDRAAADAAMGSQSVRRTGRVYVAFFVVGLFASHTLNVMIVGEADQARASEVAQVVARTGGGQESCEPPRAQPAASLIAVSKLFASKAGILWIRPRPWVEYQTENASIASGFGASTMSTKS